MRTTLSIDDDIASLVQHEVRQSGESFKATVNRLLRQGLMASREKANVKPFVITPIPIGLGPERSYDKISDILEEIEGPYHR